MFFIWLFIYILNKWKLLLPWLWVMTNSTLRNLVWVLKTYLIFLESIYFTLMVWLEGQCRALKTSCESRWMLVRFEVTNKEMVLCQTTNWSKIKIFVWLVLVRSICVCAMNRSSNHVRIASELVSQYIYTTNMLDKFNMFFSIWYPYLDPSISDSTQKIELEISN